MSAFRTILWLTLALVCAQATAGASDRYDPRLRFQTITTAGFQIHFHQGERALAQRLAELAEIVATDLAPKLGRPTQRVHVILVNQDDEPNGWATPFPYNVIEITAAEPRAASAIGNASDWLRLVFVHEYTHILHLDRSRGIFGGLRRVFGRNPILLPNIFVPPWQIEGMATYHESAATGEGRVRAGDFRFLLDRTAGTRRFLSLDEASSGRVDWPSGHTSYLYGAFFHQYLADTYGEASLTRLADATAARLPYLGSRAFKAVFKKSLGELWTDFAASAAQPGSRGASPAARLTHHGFVVSSPGYSPDGRLFYSMSNADGFPALMELRADGSSGQVATRVGGGRLGASRDAIVFDQLEYVRSVGVQSDLFSVMPETGSVTRLTREARAGDPDVSPDGQTIVCTIQEADRRFIATLPATVAGSSPKALISEPGVSFASPRWSPDGRTIVAERRRLRGTSEIVLIDAVTGAILRVLSNADGRSSAPSWLPDGSGVLFSSARAGRPFEVQRADLTTGHLQRLLNAGESAQSPVVSPDGQTLVFVGYTADGFDLFSLRSSEAEWSADVRGPEADQPGSRIQAAAGSAAQPADPVSTYRPWPELLPRFWTPIIEADGDDTAIGAATAGADPLGRHAYAVGAAWSTRARPDWYAAYLYDRWRPTVSLSFSDDTDQWRSGTVRTRELNTGLTLPFRTFRRAQSLFAAVHASSDAFTCADCATPVDETITRRAVRGGWSFNTARAYGYSISPEDGLSVNTSAEWAPKSFGSSGTASAAVLDARAFLPSRPGRSVIALRAAGAVAWGDEEGRREFGAGGPGPRFRGASFDRDAVALVRGFDTDDVVGRRAVVLNADYRVPILWMERGVGTWPLSLRSVHGAVFADAGAAWNGRLARRHQRGSIGGELSADVVLGYAIPVTIASGIAWRHDPTQANRGLAFFARVGRAF